MSLRFTDHCSRFSFAWATQSHASLAPREFFEIVAEVFPYPLQSVLTDNGSEFMKHFDEELCRLHKNHWHTYPKTPKMKAHGERFNRTLQEAFIDYHEELLLDPNQFNGLLIPWLIWYNAERPHWALELYSPLQFLLKQNPALCNSWWPNTLDCSRWVLVLYFFRLKADHMKQGIHPEYKVSTITCACGQVVETRSTAGNIHVEICSNCHPFFTGKQKLLDSAGRVDKFRKKYGLKN